MEIYASLPTKWTLRVNFKRDEKISFLLTRGMRVKRKTTLRKVYRSTIIPLCRLLSFTETFHMDYCPEKKRDFCSQLLDFLEQQAKTQSSFLLSRFMRCPLEPLEPTFPFPSISFFSYEKMWQTYARTIQPDSNYFPKFIYLISDLLAFSKFNV